MAVGDLMLQTPVITLKSPFSEIPLNEVFSEKSGERRQKKRKVKYSVRLRNAIYNRNLQQQESECNLSKRKRVKPNCLDADQRELLSLQVQRTMIADEDGDRPIHIAVAQGDVTLLKKLCFLMKSVGGSLDVINHLRQTPLHVAVIVGNSEATDILLCNGASLSREDRHGNNAVQLAVKYYSKETFSTVLKHRPTTNILNALDYEGFAALHYAIKSRNATAVRGLHEAGASINVSDGKSGRTCLSHAVFADDEEMIHLLLQCQACVEKVDYAGQSALDMALQKGNRTVIKLLEKESGGAYMSERDSDCGRKFGSKKHKEASSVL